METITIDRVRALIDFVQLTSLRGRARVAALAARVAPGSRFGYYRKLLGQRGQLAHPLQQRLVAKALLIEYVALFG